MVSFSYFLSSSTGAEKAQSYQLEDNKIFQVLQTSSTGAKHSYCCLLEEVINFVKSETPSNKQIFANSHMLEDE